MCMCTQEMDGYFTHANHRAKDKQYSRSHAVAWYAVSPAKSGMDKSLKVTSPTELKLVNIAIIKTCLG